MIKKSLITLLIVILVAALGAAAYHITKRGSQDGAGELTVAATFYPLYDFAKQVGGDRVNVINITPAGAEPHDYEPSPQELIRAHEAEVFVYNGGFMEPWVDSFLADYAHTAVRASDGIALHETGHAHSHGDEEHDDGHSHEDEAIQDPHFWLDPVRAQQIVNGIRDGLIQVDPDNRQYYTDNAEQYNQELAELDRHFAEGLSSCTLDTVISSHAAFSYLADRYGFSVVSIAGIEPSDEPSVAKMAEITDLVKQKNIRYIFFESLVSPRLAETIAREAGADTLVFDPIEGLSQADQEKGKDYISVQYDNLSNLRKALGCR